ncbi:MAG: RNase H [Eubacterium sp.]|jgi:ribonuclease HI|nr:RNase H [Eubacterium sp.]
MAKKYYAVKVGSNTGVFETWEECKDSIDGYPGALYKSFKNISDAYAYLGLDGEQLSIFTLESSDKPSSQTIPEQDTTDTDKPFSTDIKAVAYVDGSFNVETGVFGYGVVMFHNGEEIHLSDSSDDKEMASMRNVAGEIYGSMAAMEYAIEHNIKNLSIYYDYMGIAKWCTGEWKTNKPGTIAYKKYYDKIKRKVNITFYKVKGHSGDKYNNLVDKLAKKVCGII